MTTTVTSSTTTEKGSRWWTLLLPSMITALVWALPPALSFSSLPPVVGFIGMVVMLTSPAVVAVGIHFDRKYVASVSEWEPCSEYILLGVAMLAGIGIPFALLYLYRRHRYVGVP